MHVIYKIPISKACRMKIYPRMAPALRCAQGLRSEWGTQGWRHGPPMAIDVGCSSSVPAIHPSFPYHLGVSRVIGGSPKCLVYSGKSYENGWFRGYRHFRKTPFSWNLETNCSALGFSQSRKLILLNSFSGQMCVKTMRTTPKENEWGCTNNHLNMIPSGYLT